VARRNEWNFRQFLASRVTWGECDLRVDPLGRLVPPSSPTLGRRSKVPESVPGVSGRSY
jgi:hypothetical protein